MGKLKYGIAAAAFLLASCAYTVAARHEEALKIQKWVQSTVKIETDLGSGSGTVVSSKGGHVLVLTCAHVIHGPDGIFLVSPLLGRVPAELEKLDEEEDLALLSANGSAPALPIAAKEPWLYSKVYLLGSPLGAFGTVTEAYLSDKAHPWKPGSPRYYVTGGLVLFGISGGTAVNSRGELIGVPEAVRVMPNQAVPEMGFLVSLPAIKAFLKGYVL